MEEATTIHWVKTSLGSRIQAQTMLHWKRDGIKRRGNSRPRADAHGLAVCPSATRQLVKAVLDTRLPLLPDSSLSTPNPTLVSYTSPYPWDNGSLDTPGSASCEKASRSMKQGRRRSHSVHGRPGKGWEDHRGPVHMRASPRLMLSGTPRA